MEALNITIDNFETEVMQSDKPVLIDFWAISVWTHKWYS